MKVFATKGPAFTLLEMVMSLACGSVVLAAVVVAGVAMQRSFSAVESYSSAEGDELRVLDYIAMDCRRANGVSVTGNVLTLTLPQYYSAADNTAAPNTPTLTSGTLSYGSNGIAVSYYKSANNFIREVKVTNSGGTVLSDTTSTIATNVSSFTVTPLDQSSTNGTVTCSTMFFPTFLRNSGSGTWRSGGTVPDSSVGVDGDWYVIDTTASTPSSVGDVYLKSGGSYSKIQNVKATQVYCNTFLRNAVARQ